MRRVFTLVYTCIAVLLLVTLSVYGQQPTPKQIVVTLKAKPTPTAISLAWANTAGTVTVTQTLYRKTKGSFQFEELSSLEKNDSTYVDSSIEPGTMYEYEVRKIFYLSADTKKTNYPAYGYVATGAEVLPLIGKGTVILAIDETMLTPLSAEIEQYIRTLLAQGYSVEKVAVPRAEVFNSSAVKTTKSKLMEVVANNGDVQYVVLLGRVAVPYSGMFYNGAPITAPDGHNDHRGAWAADTYYGYTGDESGWEDVQTDTTGSQARTRNIEGDGKFDNAIIPDLLTLRVGRIDFFGMTKFKKQGQTDLQNETELLRSYLMKDIAYRTAQSVPTLRALVDDNFGFGPGSFSSSAWMSFPSLVGSENIKETDFFTELDTAQYYWAFGCGGGSYESAGGIGSTSDFASKSPKATFSMLFGSYFGDFDVPNNFLRAAIASSSSILTCSWSGRPFWHHHTMAMGESMGDAALISQNSVCFPGFYGQYGVHTCLMGDPTLRMRYGVIPSVKNVTAVQKDKAVTLQWEKSVGDVRGYVVYKRVVSSGNSYMLEAITPEVITTNTFVDTQLSEGTVEYYVAAVVLTTTPSGSFQEIGTATVVSTAVTSVAEEIEGTLQCKVVPNPANNHAEIQVITARETQLSVEVYTMQGVLRSTLFTGNVGAGLQKVQWNIDDTSFSQGVYLIKISTEKNQIVQKLVLQR